MAVGSMPSIGFHSVSSPSSQSAGWSSVAATRLSKKSPPCSQAPRHPRSYEKCPVHPEESSSPLTQLPTVLVNPPAQVVHPAASSHWSMDDITHRHRHGPQFPAAQDHAAARSTTTLSPASLNQTAKHRDITARAKAGGIPLLLLPPQDRSGLFHRHVRRRRAPCGGGISRRVHAHRLPADESSTRRHRLNVQHSDYCPRINPPRVRASPVPSRETSSRS